MINLQYTILALCTLVLISCSSGEKETIKTKKNYALISGKITNPDGDMVSISNASHKMKTTVGKDGTFSDTLFLDKAERFSFAHGEESSAMYIAPGAAIYITLSPEKFDETISYSGEGSTISNYLAKKFLLKEEIIGEDYALYKEEPAAFIEGVEKVKKTLEKTLNETTGIEGPFKEMELKSLVFYEKAMRKNYPMYHGHFAKIKDYEAPDNFIDTTAVAYNDAILYDFSEDYQSLAMGSVMEKAYKKAGDDETKFLNLLIKDIDEVSINSLKNDLIQQSLMFIKSDTDISEMEAKLLAMTSEEKLQEKIKNKFSLMKNLAEGKLAPDFKDFEDPTGEKYALSDLKGKYVYIDVWATWCGPCKAEIPFLKKVEKKYHNKNITFLSISMDVPDKKETWKSFVKENELGGIQIISNNGFDTSFADEFGINSIPRFILLDPEGKIVSADAPRPSQDALMSLFNELKI